MIINMVAGGKSPTGTKKITKNGAYDVTDFATANVNVPADAPVLLWTNPNPTSDFSAQTVAVNGNEYDAYLIEILGDSRYENKDITFVPKTDDYGMLTSQGQTKFTPADTCKRRVQKVTSTQIVFKDGYSGSNDIGKSYGIPQRIWGVKFSL